jgi:rod shape-determining protein MreD
VPAPIRIGLIGFVVLLVQWLVLGRLPILGATPDAVILLVAWLGLRLGRRWGTGLGFAAGVLMDAVYDTWGMHALLKCVVGFVLGLFATEEREELVITPRQALLGGLAISFFHNGIQVAFLTLQTGEASKTLTLTLWIGSSIYTALVGTLAALLANR